MNEQILEISRATEIEASPVIVWQSMLEEIGPALRTPDGKPMPLRLEPWPGGRYFRDLGDNAGHLWAHVQVIKPPTLLELCGPLMMSYPVMNHVQYRIAPRGKGSTLTITHRAFGLIDPQHRSGVATGWENELHRISAAALAAANHN